MRLHLLAFPHTETTTEYESCAYTSKARKLATMLTRAGVPVILYGGEENEAECQEHVVCVTRDEQRGWWPDYGPGKQMVFNDFDIKSPGWSTFNQRAAAAIAERATPGDILGLSMGWSHKPVADAFPDGTLAPVETGIGYEGVWAPYRVFESHAWRTYMASKEPSDDARLFDTVIPNFFEPEAFPAGRGDGSYYLYIGRLIRRKGIEIAAETCRAIGAKLVVAGQGARSWSRSKIVCEDGTVLTGDIEYVGIVGPQERAELMGGAVASFVPTLYLEPFGGVSVEAQMTGTPAIVTNWGGLPENVIHGQTGFVCSTLADFVEAALAAPSLDRTYIRSHAQATWSCDVLAQRYVRYFEQLATLRDGSNGWYSLRRLASSLPVSSPTSSRSSSSRRAGKRTRSWSPLAAGRSRFDSPSSPPSSSSPGSSDLGSASAD